MNLSFRGLTLVGALMVFAGASAQEAASPPSEGSSEPTLSDMTASGFGQEVAATGMATEPFIAPSESETMNLALSMEELQPPQNPVPEPFTMTLAAGALGAAALRKRRNRLAR